MTRGRPNRRVHAAAWWVWAMALGVAATRTTNPILLLLIAGVAGYIVATCRGDAPWGRSYGAFLRLAAVVLLIRVLFHVLLGGLAGPTILVTLPELPLPDWAAGIRIGGPVSAEGIVYAASDGLRLGVLLACVGAANALADARRLLASMPGALSEVSVAISVGLTAAPQLVASAVRIRRARQLRGTGARGVRGFVSLLVPVVEDAFDRSLSMAATMDSRGYGRIGSISVRQRRLVTILLTGGLLGLALGAYGSLDTTAPDMLGLPMLLLGGLLGITGIIIGSKRVARTHYRPDPWTWTETVIALSGVASVIGILITERTGGAGLIPAFTPLEIPELPPFAAIGVLIALLPTFVARTELPRHDPTPIEPARTGAPA